MRHATMPTARVIAASCTTALPAHPRPVPGGSRHRQHQRVRAAHAARGLPPRRPRAPAASRVNVTSFQAVCFGHKFGRAVGQSNNPMNEWQCARATEAAGRRKNLGALPRREAHPAHARATNCGSCSRGAAVAAVAGWRHVLEARRAQIQTTTGCPRRAPTSRCGVLSISKRDLWSWKGRYGILRCGWSVWRARSMGGTGENGRL